MLSLDIYVGWGGYESRCSCWLKDKFSDKRLLYNTGREASTLVLSYMDGRGA